MKKKINIQITIFLMLLLSISMSINVSASTVKAIKNNQKVDINYDGIKEEIVVLNNAADSFQDFSFVKYTAYADKKSIFTYEISRSTSLSVRYIRINKKMQYLNIITKYKKKVTSSILIKYNSKKKTYSKVNNFLGKKSAKKCYVEKASSKKLTVKTKYINGKTKTTIYKYKKSKWTK